MRPMDLWITQGYLALRSEEGERPERLLELEAAQDPLARLPEILEGLSAPREGEKAETPSLRCVLGPNYSFLRTFTFPPINKNKLAKIVEFELENHLLSGVDDYLWSFLQEGKGKEMSQVLVYGVPKSLLASLEERLDEAGVELEGLFLVQNLLDLELKPKTGGGSFLMVGLEKGRAHFLVYKQGLLKEAGHLALSGDWPTSLLRLNRQIRSILLSDPELELRLDPLIEPHLAVGPEGDLSLKSEAPPLSFLPERAAMQGLFSADPSLINLRKKARFNLETIKEKATEFKRAGILLAVSFLVFLMGMGYEIYSKSNELEELHAQMTEIAKRYVPTAQGASSLKQIEAELKKYSKQEVQAKSFYEGGYSMSRLLKELSGLKGKVKGLFVERVTASDKGFSLHGKVMGQEEYLTLSEEAKKLFGPGKYEVQLSQRSADAGLAVTMTVNKR